MRVDNDITYRPKMFSNLSLSQYQLEKTPFEFEDMGTSGSAAMSVFRYTEFSKNGYFSWGAKCPVCHRNVWPYVCVVCGVTVVSTS